MPVITHINNDIPVTLADGDILRTSLSSDQTAWLEGTIESDVAVDFTLVSEVIDAPGTFKVIADVETLTPDKMEIYVYRVTNKCAVQVTNSSGGDAIVKLNTYGRKVQ